MDLPERFIRLIWQRQLFTTAGLTTSDGRAVVILSPGRVNEDAGPDFSDARIRIGSTTFQGDVELHRTAADWHAHGHQTDPHYNRVILHVVMFDDGMRPPAATAAHRTLPVLVLHPFLDRGSGTALMASLSDGEDGAAPPLACRTANTNVSTSVIRRWIEHQAEARMQLKIHRFHERLRELIDERRSIVREPYPRYYGNPDDIPKPREAFTQRDAASRQLWEQLLYEGMMEGLGYAKNEAAFAALARSVPLVTLARQGLHDTPAIMALLFGTAGLLPSTRKVSDRESRAYLRPLRRRWRELRPVIKGPLLHEADWRFFRLRPGNFPTVRLAAFCRLLPKLFGEDGFRRTVTLFKSHTLSSKDRRRGLVVQCTDTPDLFWLHHYRFARASRTSGSGLGASRADDLVVNVILPIVLLYARVFRDATVRRNARAFLADLPPTQQNTICRRVEEQLLGDKVRLGSAFLQQGAIQLYRFYCQLGRCDECEVGKIAFQRNR